MDKVDGFRQGIVAGDHIGGIARGEQQLQAGLE